MTVLVPQDFHSFIFQLKAYTSARKYIFGETSVLNNQLCHVVERIKKHSIDYKVALPEMKT
jgi:hypothetical protein